MNIILYFGSFNPIHLGHIIIANYIVEYIENINSVWFIVSPQNPLKKNLLDYNIRENMVKISISDFKKMNISDIESGFYPSYTIETLNRIRKMYPIIKFSILLGEDVFSSLRKWKNYQVILNEYDIFVYPRIGNFPIPVFKQKKKIYLKNAPIIGISSSFIRNSIKKGKNVKPFLHSKVWNYINKYNIYQK
ncbi:nicotinate (nicotinamide) nucleotide adenylyltransferase [Blattabacterium cuenoti]|uniref:nicotinate (nicotinamide) nucleotide adenylyltransferase n=1 Tax=Blattabacterium cuenoti TaxID=1653831 RepID=UPI00163CF32A|nr:nicotinate (nicotinamide) nucleotide adenylyltransferase [Blattabacterium cuenoti]